MHEIAYAGEQPDRQAHGDEGPTPESINRARTAQRLERAAFTLETGVWLKPNGRMLHWTHECDFDVHGTLRAVEELPRSALHQFDGFLVQRVSTLVH